MTGAIVAAMAVMLIAVGVEQRAVFRAGARDARLCGDTIALRDLTAMLEREIRADACAKLRSYSVDECGRKTWLADAPMVFGARNWRLKIEVVDDAAVAACPTAPSIPRAG